MYIPLNPKHESSFLPHANNSLALVNAKICLSSTATSTISSPNKLSTILGFCEDSKEPCPRQPSDPFPEYNYKIN